MRHASGVRGQPARPVRRPAARAHVHARGLRLWCERARCPRRPSPAGPLGRRSPGSARQSSEELMRIAESLSDAAGGCLVRDRLRTLTGPTQAPGATTDCFQLATVDHDQRLGDSGEQNPTQRLVDAATSCCRWRYPSSRSARLIRWRSAPPPSKRRPISVDVSRRQLPSPLRRRTRRRRADGAHRQAEANTEMENRQCMNAELNRFDRSWCTIKLSECSLYKRKKEKEFIYNRY